MTVNVRQTNQPPTQGCHPLDPPFYLSAAVAALDVDCHWALKTVCYAFASDSEFGQFSVYFSVDGRILNRCQLKANCGVEASSEAGRNVSARDQFIAFNSEALIPDADATNTQWLQVGRGEPSAIS